MNFKGKTRFFNHNKSPIETHTKFSDSVTMSEGLGNATHSVIQTAPNHSNI